MHRAQPTRSTLASSLLLSERQGLTSTAKCFADLDKIDEYTASIARLRLELSTARWLRKNRKLLFRPLKLLSEAKPCSMRPA